MNKNGWPFLLRVFTIVLTCIGIIAGAGIAWGSLENRMTNVETAQETVMNKLDKIYDLLIRSPM